MPKLKCLFLILCLLLSLALGASAVTIPGYYDSSEYTSFNAAVAAIGGREATLVVSRPETLTGQLPPIPSTLTLKIIQGGTIIKASNYTLTINGPFEAGRYQVFSGFSSGDVTGAFSQVYPEWWRNNTEPGSTDMTAAFSSAVSSIATTGGIIDLAATTYNGQLNSSNRNSISKIKIRGAGITNTILQYHSGIVLDLASSSRVDIEDLTINAQPGAELNIFAGRYTDQPFAGTFLYVNRVRLTGTPSVAGLYLIGAEASRFENCDFHVEGSRPQVIISGDNCESYTSAHGTILSPASQFTTKFENCIFVKQPGSGNTGNVIEVGSNVAQLEFSHCYFHAVNGYAHFNFKGTNYPSYFIDIHNSGFEANELKPGQGVDAIKVTGAVVLNYLKVTDNFFYYGRKKAGVYDINCPNGSINNSTIKRNKSSYGGGLYIHALSQSEIEWEGNHTILKEGITATKVTFTAAAGHAIQVGDTVRVGNSRRNPGAGGSNPPETRTVINVATNTITVGSGFTYSHPTGEMVRYGKLYFETDQNSRFVTTWAPTFNSLCLASKVTLDDYDKDYRDYYGPYGANDVGQAPLIVNKAFGTEPNSPETGMFVTANGANWDPSSSGYRSSYPVFHDGTQWWTMTAIPLTPERANAACTKGTIAFDGNYVYVCVATNSWIRIAKAAW